MKGDHNNNKIPLLIPYQQQGQDSIGVEGPSFPWPSCCTHFQSYGVCLRKNCLQTSPQLPQTMALKCEAQLEGDLWWPEVSVLHGLPGTVAIWMVMAHPKTIKSIAGRSMALSTGSTAKTLVTHTLVHSSTHLGMWGKREWRDRRQHLQVAHSSGFSFW